MAPTIHMIGAKEDWFSFQLFESSLHKIYYTATIIKRHSGGLQFET